jgi:hypothetical protein
MIRASHLAPIGFGWVLPAFLLCVCLHAAYIGDREHRAPVPVQTLGLVTSAILYLSVTGIQRLSFRRSSLSSL